MSSNLPRDSVFGNHSYARQNATSCPLASEFSPNFRSTELTILTLIIAVQLLSGVSLNSMALFIQVTNSSLLKIPANRILCSLVINDLVSSTIFLPYHAYLFRQSSVTLVEIRAYRTAAAFCSTWSVLNCLAITADRSLAILYPLRYNSLIVALKARLLVVLAVGITTVFTLSLFATLYLGKNFLKLILEYMAVVILLLPVFLYWKIYRSAREQTKEITIASRTKRRKLKN